MVPTRLMCAEVVGDRSPFGVSDEMVADLVSAIESAGSTALDRQLSAVACSLVFERSMRPATTIGGGASNSSSVMDAR